MKSSSTKGKKKLTYLQTKAINDEWEQIKKEQKEREKQITDTTVVLGLNPEDAIEKEVKKQNEIVKTFLRKTIAKL